jgi:prepilin-type N-terminal cleavage/methylation domain-containing protein
MLRNKIKDKSGFTLAEVIIAVAISSLIVLMISSSYFVAQRAYVKADSKAEISQNGRVILDRLARELRQTPDIVTPLPADNSNPELTPNEIMFQDGHNTSQITYIRYYASGTDIYRQIIAYYYDSDPNTYVRWHGSEPLPPGDPPPPLMKILEDRLIGEYVSNLEFWGTKKPTYINLNMHKNKENVILNTAVYGRNL